MPRPPHVPLAEIPPDHVNRALHNLKVFAAVWQLVAVRQYDQKLNGADWRAEGAKFGAEAARAVDDKGLYEVLNRMLALLNDSHTHALTPDQTQERSIQRRARTGFLLSKIDGKWVVEEVLPGSPAALGGVKPGWIITARNGLGLDDNRVDFNVVEGDVVTWDFIDARDQPVKLDLVARALSTRPRQEVRVLDGGYVYLRFDGFDVTDRRWLHAQLKEHREAPGVILDLRHNGGGDIISLGLVAGDFFAHAVDCGTFVERTGSSYHKHSWQWGSVHYAGRVAILEAGPTASAAEIFTATMQDQERAKIFGRKSAGAVLSSWFYVLPDRGELQLSRDDYRAPKGRRLEGTGIEPDVAVPKKLEELRAGRDADVEAALAYLRER